MNLHLVAVYFPVGLLVASVVFDLIAQVTHREELATVGWWTLVSGALMALVALVTGILEEPVPEATSAAARTALDVHSTLAYVATILFAVLALWRLIGRGRIVERARPAYLAAGVIAAALLVATMYTGVRSVYVYAIGIPDATLEAAVEMRGHRLTPPTLPADTLQPGPDTPGAGDEDRPPTDTIRTD